MFSELNCCTSDTAEASSVANVVRISDSTHVSHSLTLGCSVRDTAFLKTTYGLCEVKVKEENKFMYQCVTKLLLHPQDCQGWNCRHFGILLSLFEKKIGQSGVQFVMNEMIFMKWIIYSTKDLKPSKVMILASKSAILATAKRSLKNFELQRGSNPWHRHAGAMLQMSHEATDLYTIVYNTFYIERGNKV